MPVLLNFHFQLIVYIGVALRLSIIKACLDNGNDDNNFLEQIIRVTDSEVNIIPTAEEWRSITGKKAVPGNNLTNTRESKLYLMTTLLIFIHYIYKHNFRIQLLDEFATVDVNFGTGHRGENGKRISISFNSTKLRKRFQLKLKPNEHIVDPHFIALMRKSNHSLVIAADNVPELDCYYQSKEENFAALDLCEGVLRGLVLVDPSSIFVIHPLPIHYRNTPKTNIVRHIVIKTNPEFGFGNTIEYKARRRKRYATSSQDNEILECGNSYLNKSRANFGDVPRPKRETDMPPPNTELSIEIAVFVDRDLFNHMTATFPENTEKELIRFVLALVNAVHLLYHDPTLGWIINFVLKRLEILHTDPSNLNRVHDIDKFLSSFCMWQHNQNPTSDDDPLHWDHAVILTGLDLYVLSKNGKASNQVVGLAPVAGMCTATSSCTVNEGRHFESAYVVAHEIGHNLGMRHDGPTADNSCDPSAFLMSPTLGSGKTTWSTCSKQYLETFLRSKQARCLFDRGSTSQVLDHSFNGVLPGERFDVHQQCKLKYGIESVHSFTQPLEEVCKDLQCFRGNYMWTSHPALEGTICGENKWCRSGRCIEKGLTVLEAGFAPHQVVNGGWSGWSPYSECASSCLHDEKGNLSLGSVGITVASRRCNNPRPENGGEMCPGNDQKYQTCVTHQCHKVAKVTLKEFSNDICKRASEVDAELTGTGQQRISANPREACTVWCNKKAGGYKSRGGSYPDGTVCHLRKFKKSTYCIQGHCKEFTCAQSPKDLVIYAHDEEFCSQNTVPRDKRREALLTSHWIPVSDCFFNCVVPGTGMRLVEKKQCSSCNSTTNVQICQDIRMCNTFKTITEYATTVCNKFSQRVRRLSGLGMQLSSTTDDPHRPCRLACQDEKVVHRFYLVNGEEGWFPFGTDCTLGDVNRKAFCVYGKCVEFNADNIPSHDFDHFFAITGRIKREAGHHPESESTIQDGNEYLQPSPSIDLGNPITLERNAIEPSNSNVQILSR